MSVLIIYVLTPFEWIWTEVFSTSTLNITSCNQQFSVMQQSSLNGIQAN